MFDSLGLACLDLSNTAVITEAAPGHPVRRSSLCWKSPLPTVGGFAGVRSYGQAEQPMALRVYDHDHRSACSANQLSPPLLCIQEFVAGCGGLGCVEVRRYLTGPLQVDRLAQLTRFLPLLSELVLAACDLFLIFLALCQGPSAQRQRVNVKEQEDWVVRGGAPASRALPPV